MLDSATVTLLKSWEWLECLSRTRAHSRLFSSDRMWFHCLFIQPPQSSSYWQFSYHYPNKCPTTRPKNYTPELPPGPAHTRTADPNISPNLPAGHNILSKIQWAGYGDQFWRMEGRLLIWPRILHGIRRFLLFGGCILFRFVSARCSWNRWILYFLTFSCFFHFCYSTLRDWNTPGPHPGPVQMADLSWVEVR